MPRAVKDVRLGPSGRVRVGRNRTAFARSLHAEVVVWIAAWMGAAACAGCPSAALDVAATTGRWDPRLADAVVVDVSERWLALFRRGAAVGCWRVALGVHADGSFADGAKRVRGDRRTPQGWYRLSDKPESRFAGALAVHYPNADDARRAFDDARIDATTRDRIAAAVVSERRPPQDTALDDSDLASLRDDLAPGLSADLLILP